MPAATTIATCPKCGATITEEHSYAWCHKCGEPLPSDILERLPRVQAKRAAAAVMADAPQPPAQAKSYVTLGDIDIPFTRMVAFMVKWSFAAIPAIIIVFLTVWLIIGIIAALFGGLFLRPH
jgi:predicted amidophosphoribosyltransferase